jgi:hypothetical protein
VKKEEGAAGSTEENKVTGSVKDSINENQSILTS